LLIKLFTVNAIRPEVIAAEWHYLSADENKSSSIHILVERTGIFLM